MTHEEIQSKLRVLDATIRDYMTNLNAARMGICSPRKMRSILDILNKSLEAYQRLYDIQQTKQKNLNKE